ncbi:hypothetical protein BDQ17DRAFT_160365 [Cyathus striatus]|nr:hypothetical protein BDQ17DRAFT_160365 [Cyathus striatus]
MHCRGGFGWVLKRPQLSQSHPLLVLIALPPSPAVTIISLPSFHSLAIFPLRLVSFPPSPCIVLYIPIPMPSYIFSYPLHLPHWCVLMRQAKTISQDLHSQVIDTSVRVCIAVGCSRCDRDL